MIQATVSQSVGKIRQAHRQTVRSCAICVLACLFARVGFADLPFSTSETTETLPVKIRHKVRYHIKTGAVDWDLLEVDVGQDAHLILAPGSFDPAAEGLRRFEVRLDVKDGWIEAQSEIDREAWATQATIKLDPRDVRWNDPLIEVKGLAIDGGIALDSRLDMGPLVMLDRLNLSPLKIDSIKAGAYESSDIVIEGLWNRPTWLIQEFEAAIFGGWIEMIGQGQWGTSEPSRLSLAVEVLGVELQQVLQSFNFPRADQIQARVDGDGEIEVEGEKWKRLNFNLRGEKGSVFLTRRLIYDILAPSIVGVLTTEAIDFTLNGFFGDAALIPFDEMSIAGSMDEDILRIQLRFVNDALVLSVDNNIEEAIVWDAWNKLIHSGLKNVGFEKIEHEGRVKGN